jgi:hypothetical protein
VPITKLGAACHAADRQAISRENVMRLSLAVPLFILACGVLTQAQTGPCTESVITKGNLPAADDAFSYKPKDGVCRVVAFTMQPLEEQPAR